MKCRYMKSAVLPLVVTTITLVVLGPSRLSSVKAEALTGGDNCRCQITIQCNTIASCASSNSYVGCKDDQNAKHNCTVNQSQPCGTGSGCQNQFGASGNNSAC